MTAISRSTSLSWLWLAGAFLLASLLWAALLIREVMPDNIVTLPSNPAIDGFITIARPLPDITPGLHAQERHGTIADQARNAIKNCPPDQIRSFLGKSKYSGFYLWACRLGTSDKGIAVWIAVPATTEEIAAGSPEWREVTAFISKGWSYIDSLLAQDMYQELPGQFPK